jgi:hypothetical protein
VTASEYFIRDLHDAYALRDISGLDEAVVELAEFLPPLHPPEPETFASGGDGAQTSFQVQVRAVSVGGYWSTGMFLEFLGSLWQPACYRFIMHKRVFNREEVGDE